MTNKQIHRAMESRQKRMAKIRDELRELEAYVAYEAERCDSAYWSLQDAIDSLSESV